MIKIFISTLTLLMVISANASSNPIGFMRSEISSKIRALQIATWYPTSNTKLQPTQIADNIALKGIEATRDTPIRDTATLMPLVVLSHGYGGNWRNLNWLANNLAQQGYIVVAPNHPGTTTRNKEANQAVKWWERPRDISRVITWMLGSPHFKRYIDPNKIAVIGHSLGGWTALSLTGATTSPTQIVKACKVQSNPRVCRTIEYLGMNSNNGTARDIQDQRVKAVVSLDLGLAQSFTSVSLSSIRTPTLLITADKRSEYLPVDLESHYLSNAMPKDVVTLKEIKGASHFSFMPICKHGGRELIEEESPGDGIVCDDIGNTARQSIHKNISRSVLAFLKQHL